MSSNHFSTEKTKLFYNNLMQGKERRWIWGKSKRFSPYEIKHKPSVHNYFLPKIRQHIGPEHKVLDLGCGPGSFLPLVSEMCLELTGVDITPSFIQEAQSLIEADKLYNTKALLTDKHLPFPDSSFDRVIMIDTIHHLENVKTTIQEVHRVLKDDGKLVVFEPNKYNPLLWILCLLDPNERGLLNLGSIAKYETELTPLFEVTEWDWNGLLIGPSSKHALFIAESLDQHFGRKLRGLLPKIFFVAKRCKI